MRPIFFTFLFFTFLFSQENNAQQDSVLQSTEMEPDTITEMSQMSRKGTKRRGIVSRGEEERF